MTPPALHQDVPDGSVIYNSKVILGFPKLVKLSVRARDMIIMPIISLRLLGSDPDESFYTLALSVLTYQFEEVSNERDKSMDIVVLKILWAMVLKIDTDPLLPTLFSLELSLVAVEALCTV